MYVCGSVLPAKHQQACHSEDIHAERRRMRVSQIKEVIHLFPSALLTFISHTVLHIMARRLEKPLRNANSVSVIMVSNVKACEDHVIRL